MEKAFGSGKEKGAGCGRTGLGNAKGRFGTQDLSGLNSNFYAAMQEKKLVESHEYQFVAIIHVDVTLVLTLTPLHFTWDFEDCVYA